MSFYDGLNNYKSTIVIAQDEIDQFIDDLIDAKEKF